MAAMAVDMAHGCGVQYIPTAAPRRKSNYPTYIPNESK